LEKHFGSKFKPVSGASTITEQLTVAGHGSRGIVYVRSASNPGGHVFNAVNQRGNVRFLDGQTGNAESLKGWSNFQYYENKLESSL
jgi:hypothetical protein